MKLRQDQILFCDNHLLALDKPAGLLCQPSGTDELSLEQLGKLWLKEKFQKPGNVFLEAAHRIDRPVSGLVLFARTSKALSRLNAAQRDGIWRKTYQAIISGEMPQNSGRLITWLRHDEHRAIVTRPNAPESRECRLTFQVLKTNNISSLLEITLETGRYHQIRAQLANAGHPILGDSRYGSTIQYRQDEHPYGEQIALKHIRLQFPHPVTRDLLTIESSQLDFPA